MSKVRIELNYAGVGELLRSSEMEEMLRETAQEVASRAGPGYEVDTYRAGTRVIASVFTDTDEAAQDNLDNNTLLKAVGG